MIPFDTLCHVFWQSPHDTGTDTKRGSPHPIGGNSRQDVALTPRTPSPRGGGGEDTSKVECEQSISDASLLPKNQV